MKLKGFILKPIKLFFVCIGFILIGIAAVVAFLYFLVGSIIDWANYKEA